MKSFIHRALPLAIIIMISLYSVWPIVANIKTAVTDKGDSILIVWILNQTIQKIPHDLDNIFQGNIFYPHKNTLAYADLLIPSAFLAFIPVKIVGEPTVAYGVNLFLGQVATLFASYLIFSQFSKNKMSMLVATIAFGLSWARFGYIDHLQMWNMHWFLFASYFFYIFLQKEKPRYLYLTGVFLVIQFWESLLPVVFFAAVAVVMAVVFGKRSVLKKNLKHIVVVALLACFFCYPVINAYLNVSQEFNYVRSIREAAHFSASLDDYWQRFFSPGFYAIVMVLVMVVGVKELIKDKAGLFFGLVFLMGFVLSLGPALKWSGATVKMFNLPIPLPYAPLYYLLPFLKAFRTPSRWQFVAFWGLAGLIAVGLPVVKLGFKRLFYFILILVAVIGGFSIKVVYALPTSDQLPKYVYWLDRKPGEVVLELPMYTWADGVLLTKELKHLYYSLYYDKRLVNGYSGFYPPDSLAFVRQMKDAFPGGEADQAIMGLGIDYLVITKDGYELPSLEKIKSWGRRRIVYEDENTIVFSAD